MERRCKIKYQLRAGQAYDASTLQPRRMSLQFEAMTHHHLLRWRCEKKTRGRESEEIVTSWTRVTIHSDHEVRYACVLDALLPAETRFFVQERLVGIIGLGTPSAFGMNLSGPQNEPREEV